MENSLAPSGGQIGGNNQINGNDRIYQIILIIPINQIKRIDQLLSVFPSVINIIG